MFGGRPRYDDTFGVRLDLGANQKDPLSVRAVHPRAPAKVKPPVLVEQPRRLSDIFGGGGKDELAPKPAPARPAPVAASHRAPPATTRAPEPDYARRRAPASAPSGSGAETAQQIISSAVRFWGKLSLQHKIMIGAFAVWFLLSTGLIFPAVVLAVILVAVRNQAKRTG